jgi:multidrug efflux pump subunit AcrA (membrane-fusion protein)
MLEQISQFFKSTRRKNQSSSRYLPFAVIVVTIIILLIFKFVQPDPPLNKNEEKSWIVQTQRLVGGARAPQLELYGQVESPYLATLTAGINADVKSLDVKEGQFVVKGQLLIKLDELDVQLVLQQRVSEVAELEALIKSEKNRHNNDLDALKLEKSLVTLAEKKLSREEKTSKSNLTSQSSFDSQKQALENQKLALKARELAITDHPARLAQLQARLAQKRALVQQAETDLQRATINAPFDGIVLSTNVSPGERVRPGEALLKLYSTENVELRAQLPQKYINIIKQALTQGKRLYATVKANHENIIVALGRISGTITETGIGVDALFEVSDEDADSLVMGEVLEVVLDLPVIDDVYSLPLSSIYGTNRIYRVENARLTAVDVNKVGKQIKQGKQFVLVRSDKLQPGDEIITTQLPHAFSGLKVEVRNPPAADRMLSTTAPPPASELP